MGKLFYIMGKSSSGKDTVLKALMKKTDLGLQEIVLYTTRPMRAGETDGVQYHFVTEEALETLQKAGKVIELRAYEVVGGVWKYFTADDGSVDFKRQNYLAIGTLESYEKLKKYYGEDRVVPLYIEVSDGIRLERALLRERQQEHPNYEELCRRFLADSADFSEAHIRQAGIARRFANDGESARCVEEAAAFIRRHSI